MSPFLRPALLLDFSKEALDSDMKEPLHFTHHMALIALSYNERGRRVIILVKSFCLVYSRVIKCMLLCKML